jgi:hypothetical protein
MYYLWMDCNQRTGEDGAGYVFSLTANSAGGSMKGLPVEEV